MTVSKCDERRAVTSRMPYYTGQQQTHTLFTQGFSSTDTAEIKQ